MVRRLKWKRNIKKNTDSFLTDNDKEERGGGKKESPHTLAYTNAHDHKERGADETHAHVSLKSQVTSRNTHSKIPLADKAFNWGDIICFQTSTHLNKSSSISGSLHSSGGNQSYITWHSVTWHSAQHKRRATSIHSTTGRTEEADDEACLLVGHVV